MDEKFSYREALEQFVSRLMILVDEVNSLADEVDAYLMKKTTQDSPEWHGRANC